MPGSRCDPPAPVVPDRCGFGMWHSPVTAAERLLALRHVVISSFADRPGPRGKTPFLSLCEGRWRSGHQRGRQEARR